MLEKELHELSGARTTLKSLDVRKATELAALLKSGTFPFVRLVECRASDEQEIVVFDIEPEVPQHPAHDIKTEERIAVAFDPDDRRAPNPKTLRKSFPVAPHENLTPSGAPRSLCLYEERYAERRERWTAPQFVRRLHEWLSKTARGELHAGDQPLERLFLGTPLRIVLPSSFYEPDGDTPKQLLLEGATQVGTRLTLVSITPPDGIDDIAFPPDYVGFTYTAQPRTHGLIRFQPKTIAELDAYLSEGDEDILPALRERLGSWQGNGQLRPESQLVILLRVPKRREEEGGVETVELWAFATGKTVREVGEDIGQWEVLDGEIAPIIGGDKEKAGEDTGLLMLNPTPALNRSRAAAMNGLPEPSTAEHVAVGVGALGSQVALNLARAGQGRWTLVDEDELLPHNVARHASTSNTVGHPKAVIMAAYMNDLVEDEVATPLVANVLADKPGELRNAYEDAAFILDMSASAPVARHLALDVNSEARRASLFLSPHGRDLVLIVEPDGRALRLDQLEMEYYRRLATDEALSGHLRRDGQQLRYGNSCRDLSTEMPQALVALHAGIGSRAYQVATGSTTNATVKLWRAGEDLSVTSVPISPSPHRQFRVGEWQVSMSQRVAHAMQVQRSERLPNETGGVMVGTFDTQRRLVYVVHHVPSPPDREEWPTAYRRGIEGLSDTLEDISHRTGDQLGYVGEWHTHPRRSSTRASDDDKKLFDWLSAHRRKDGLPAVMTIAGDENRSRWYIGSLDSANEVTID